MGVYKKQHEKFCSNDPVNGNVKSLKNKAFARVSRDGFACDSSKQNNKCAPHMLPTTKLQHSKLGTKISAPVQKTYVRHVGDGTDLLTIL